MTRSARRSCEPDDREWDERRLGLETPPRLRVRKALIPDGDDTAFERILGTSEIFPINFLSRGMRAARAVCKVQLFHAYGGAAGSGTGFLIAPNLMMTNNHVLPTQKAALRSKALFDFALNDDFTPLHVKVAEVTDKVFLTSPKDALDFTIISLKPKTVDGTALNDFGYLRLLPHSGKAVSGESVSIIHHPQGVVKCLSLRNSKILKVRGSFITYSSDTEPGSSGAPVLNDHWQPVAIHHQALAKPGTRNQWIANQGVRISSIFEHILQESRRGQMGAKRVLDKISNNEKN